jgi:hypothetical protein
MILHLAVLVSSSTIDMAYGVRHYKQGAAKSYFQMYVANHTGANKFRISTSNCEAHAPIWLDHNHLAWVEQYDPAPIKGDDSINYRDCKARVMIYDLTNRSKKKLADLPTQSWKLSSRSEGTIFDSMRSDETNEIHRTYFRVSLKGVQIVKDGTPSPPEFGTAIAKDTDEKHAPRKATLHFGNKELKLNWNTPFRKPMEFDDEDAMKNSTVQLETTWKGKKSKITLRGNHVEKAFIAKDGTGIILTEHEGDRSLRPSFLYQFSKDFSKCKLLSNDVGPMILKPDCRYLHGYQVLHYLSSGGILDDGRTVDVSTLYTGDWTTGKQWTIESGLVQVASCRFRPGK